MKDKDIKKIFSVAWVKERKILVGSVVVVAVIGLIILVATLPSASELRAMATERCLERIESHYERCFLTATGGYFIKEDSLKNCRNSYRNDKTTCEREPGIILNNPNIK